MITQQVQKGVSALAAFYCLVTASEFVTKMKTELQGRNRVQHAAAVCCNIFLCMQIWSRVHIN